ncbi:chitin synthase-domain-containing protein, partial [Entophlyctis helioformis]
MSAALAVILGVIFVRFFMALAFHWIYAYNHQAASPNDMYTIMLVTCYSEGEAGIKGTLDSLADTDYPDDHKLLFVIADGMIKGDGNDKLTHE